MLIGWGDFRFSASSTATNTTKEFVHYRQPDLVGSISGGRYYHWLFPLCLFVKSVTWWENFVDFDLTCGKTTLIPVRRWKVQMHRLRQKATIFTSVWNIGVIFAFPLVASYCRLAQFDSFNYRISPMELFNSNRLLELAPIIANGLSSFIGFFSGSLACKLAMQKVSFNVPLLLSTPLTIGLILLQCQYEYIPKFGLYKWHCVEGFSGTELAMPDSAWQLACSGMFWITLLIITCYLWRPRHNPMDRNQK